MPVLRLNAYLREQETQAAMGPRLLSGAGPNGQTGSSQHGMQAEIGPGLQWAGPNWTEIQIGPAQMGS